MTVASSKFTKTTWEIAVFHIFYYCKVIEFQEFINVGITLSKKTMIRYIEELKNAGLLRVIYSKKENGYIHVDDSRHCPFLPPKYTQSERTNAHLDKLIRLVTIMLDAEYTEDPDWDEDEKPREDVFISWYKRTFQNVSRRTMYHDFEELNKIGYTIRYDDFDDYYSVDFPYCMEGLSLEK